MVIIRYVEPAHRKCRAACEGHMRATNGRLHALQWQQSCEARTACHPSPAISGTRTKAASGSAQRACKIAFASNPAKAMREKMPHSADSVASARKDALAVRVASFRFWLASHGIPIAAATKRIIPARLCLGSLYPSRDDPELTSTNPATQKSSAPASRAASFSSFAAQFEVGRNRQRTTIAESSSTALSPPKPRRAELFADQAAASPTITSMDIHAMVRIWRWRTRRKISGSGTTVTAAVRSSIRSSEAILLRFCAGCKTYPA